MKLLPVLTPATDEAFCAPAGPPTLGAEEAKQKALGTGQWRDTILIERRSPAI